MAYLVKCPICGLTKKIDSRVKHYFRCYRCNMQIELKPNIIAESFVLPKKEKDVNKILSGLSKEEIKDIVREVFKEIEEKKKIVMPGVEKLEIVPDDEFV
jgi:endogenous inhibitor of DNA gyrase (YacG/DUF329 family)